jgi:hypothetical protein
MTTQHLSGNTVDADTKWLYQVGGISAFVLGMGYFIIIALYISAGGPPLGSDIGTRLIYLAEHSTAWWGIVSLSVLTDLLYIPITFALYFALKGINRNMMLLGTACILLFVVLELGISWMNYAVLLDLGSSYVAAVNDAQREVIVMTASYPFAVLDSHHLLGVYTILLTGIGIFMIGLVMLKGVFSKITAWLALISSSLTIISIVGTPFVSGLWVTIIIGSFLIAVWVFLVAHTLYRLGTQSVLPEGASK